MERRIEGPEAPRPRIRGIESVEDVSIFEVRQELIELQKRLEKLGGSKPEVNDLIRYTSFYVDFLGFSPDPEAVRRLREELSERLGPRYAALIVSHMPVTAEEITELLPRRLLRELKPEDLEEIAKKIRDFVKSNF